VVLLIASFNRQHAARPRSFAGAGFAIRLAIGGSRARVVGQPSLSLLVALVGAGGSVHMVGHRGIVRALPASLPFVQRRSVARYARALATLAFAVAGTLLRASVRRCISRGRI
jgi:hypothetical protein